MSPRRNAKDPRPLMLKIRVVAKRGLIKKKEDLLAAIKSAIDTKVVPDGITILWIDWQKGEGGRANSGHITEDVARELEAFWLAISHEDTETELGKPGASWKLRAERTDQD